MIQCKLFVIVAVIGISSCAKKPPYSGDHSTHLIRTMWYQCVTAFQKNDPRLIPPVTAGHCDCMLDEARSFYTFKDYATAVNTGNQFTEFGITCVQKLGRIVPPPDLR